MTSPWHIVTCEYPPQLGGVSDYTCRVAEELAHSGEEVHVWAPLGPTAPELQNGVDVRRSFGTFRASDLRRVDSELNAFPAPRRLFVQWVPHGYGGRGINLGFCFWLRRRARMAGDQIDLMVHEPFLAFDRRSARHAIAAAVQRLMMAIVLHSARRVWIAIPAWESTVRPYALGKRISYAWLPVASPVPVVENRTDSEALRRRVSPTGGLIVGHFGTYGDWLREWLGATIEKLLEARSDAVVLLLGARGDEFARIFARTHPELAARIIAPGILSSGELSQHLSACDLMIQPFPDGLSGRRTSLMACLAHGKAVISTVGRLSEDLWLESGAVRLVATDDRMAFAKASIDLLADLGERDRLARAARRLYEQQFDVTATVRRLRSGVSRHRLDPGEEDHGDSR